MSYGQRVDLLILYLQWLHEHGFNLKTGIQALRFQYVLAKRCIDIFEDVTLSAARFATHPSQMHDEADRRKSNERNMVSPAMMRNMYEHTWPSKVQLATLSVDDVEAAGAVCAGFCMYHFARRVGEFLKTRSDKKWLQSAALVAGGDEEGAPQAHEIRDSRGRVLDARMAVDPHALRARNVAFAFGSRQPRVYYAASELERFPKSMPTEVRITFYSTKTKNAGKPVTEYVEPNAERPATVALTRMLYEWARYAEYDDGTDMFFSRPGIRLDVVPRKRLLDKTLDQVLVATAVRMKLSRDGAGYSTNSF